MLSERGTKLIVFNGYKFRKDRECSKGWKWRCTKKNCLAKLYMDELSSTVLDSFPFHNHSTEKMLSRQIISNNLKRKFDDITDAPRKAVRKEIREAPLHVAQDLTIKDVDYIKKNLYNSRRKELPALPVNISEVHQALCQVDTQSNFGETMLKVNDSLNNIIMFSTDSNLKYLCTRDKIFVDGTFTYCSKFFHQLFTIHSVENGHYIPLVFFLLSNKLEETYTFMFEHLKQQCSLLNLQLLPKTVVADFERAIHNAVINVWPQCKLIGCRFHLAQAWFRHIQELGLTVEYKDKNSNIGQWLRLLFALPLLDPDDADDAFADDIMPDQPQDVRVIKFTDYIVNNYMTGSLFPFQMWASASINSERTTNACESFHSHFKKNFTAPHPNIYVFVEVLKNVQVDVYILRNSTNEPKKISNTSFRKRKEIIERLMMNLSTGVITRLHFLKCVSYYCKI